MRLLVRAVARLFESALFLDDLRAFLAASAPRRDGGRLLGGFEALAAHEVRFHYPSSDHDTLDRVDLELRRGEVVALVGENGCGKTTLLKVLARLYAPTSGVVEWDGVDVAELDPVALRRRIAVVFQHFVR